MWYTLSVPTVGLKIPEGNLHGYGYTISSVDRIKPPGRNLVVYLFTD